MKKALIPVLGVVVAVATVANALLITQPQAQTDTVPQRALKMARLMGGTGLTGHYVDTATRRLGAEGRLNLKGGLGVAWCFVGSSPLGAAAIMTHYLGPWEPQVQPAKPQAKV